MYFKTLPSGYCKGGLEIVWIQTLVSKSIYRKTIIAKLPKESFTTNKKLIIIIKLLGIKLSKWERIVLSVFLIELN